MSKFVVCETIRQYHEVDIDDELVISVLVNQANRLLDKFDSGAEALEYILKLYQDRYGFDYNLKNCGCGQETVDISVHDEIDQEMMIE